MASLFHWHLKFLYYAAHWRGSGFSYSTGSLVYHPIHNAEGFYRASRTAFLAIEQDDPLYQQEEVWERFRTLGALRVTDARK